MPGDGILGDINGFGMQLIGNTANAWMQGRQNRQSRQWAEKMYQQQRSDALADWERQNQYNLPSSQMARLKAAGLNPNLVYGNGATYSAGTVRGSSVGNYSPGRSEFNVQPGGMSLNQFFDAQVRQAQIDNLRAQNKVIEEEAMLKAASRGKVLQDTEIGQYMKEVNFDYKVNAIDALAKRTLLTEEELDIIRRSKEDRIQAVAEQVLLMRASRARTDEDAERLRHAAHVLMQDEELKQLDIDLKKLGVQPTDEIWQRILARILNFEANK